MASRRYSSAVNTTRKEVAIMMWLRMLVALVVLVSIGCDEGGGGTDDGTIMLRTDRSYYSYNTAPRGGEMGVSEFDGLRPASTGPGVSISGNLFQTFCIERNEWVQADGVTQYDWSLGTAAHAGGQGGGVNGADPLSDESAWLFTQFWTGTLDQYDYEGLNTRSRADSAWQLQLAIWVLEQELPEDEVGTLGRHWLDEARTAVSTGEWSGLGGVRVLTLTDSAGLPAQDLLVIVSTAR